MSQFRLCLWDRGIENTNVNTKSGPFRGVIAGNTQQGRRAPSDVTHVTHEHLRLQDMPASAGGTRTSHIHTSTRVEEGSHQRTITLMYAVAHMTKVIPARILFHTRHTCGREMHALSGVIRIAQ